MGADFGEKKNFPWPFPKECFIAAEKSTHVFCLMNVQKLDKFHETHTQVKKQNITNTPRAPNPGFLLIADGPGPTSKSTAQLCLLLGFTSIAQAAR